MPAETGWFAAGKKERGLPSELADSVNNAHVSNIW
jgi:hypothetical protein